MYLKITKGTYSNRETRKVIKLLVLIACNLCTKLCNNVSLNLIHHRGTCRDIPWFTTYLSFYHKNIPLVTCRGGSLHTLPSIVILSTTEEHTMVHYIHVGVWMNNIVNNIIYIFINRCQFHNSSYHMISCHRHMYTASWQLCHCRCDGAVFHISTHSLSFGPSGGCSIGYCWHGRCISGRSSFFANWWRLVCVCRSVLFCV